ncbi:MAG: hypothetical protein FWG48_06585, partial [Oscillospiraceae bacterium]|nr:hypothetical protein [Oscillospiraceae bacterium]
LTLLVIGLLLRIEERRSGGLVLYCIAVYLMATSKFAWIPVGILFALAPLGFLLSKDIGFSRKKLIAFCSVTVCALLAFYALLIPSWIDRDTTFTAVFDGVLRNSQTPEQDLEELGLDPGYAVLQGWQAYMDGYPIDISSEEFNEGFFGQVSKAKILAFYLKHPSRLLDVLRESARYARYIRAPYLTSVQNPEFWGDQAYRFSLWERARVAIAPLANFWFIAAVLALGAAAAIAKLRSIIKRKAGGLSVMHPILLLVLIASAAGSFIMPYISNGIADQAKQLFGFINLFDIIIFTLIGCVVYSVDFSKIVKAVRRK